MLFNSLGFVIFFPLVVLFYWFLPNRFRNSFLLVASYYFYMNWEPMYALLIAFSSVTTWGCGLLMEKFTDRKKLILTVCLTVNFLILFIFKYFGFITTSVHDALSHLGISMYVPSFELLLPVGISFYTFQAVGYSIDVYRGTLKAEKSLMTYALFVSFFPQLVAGPIERASNLLPQFHKPHFFNQYNVISGLKTMTWGYFMKLCIADNVSPYVDAVYNNIPMHNGTSILLATFFFTFQIFCDFCGYSLIAIGTARCIGFSLMQNFRQPYLATSVKDFWRRWHISLSTWFSDYLYIPLGGNRCSPIKHKRNLFITFLVSGLWHGANWTFVLWGAYHGVLQIVHSIRAKIKWLTLPQNCLTTVIQNCLTTLISILTTFCLVMIGWVFFRANSVSDAFLALRKMATDHGMLFNGDGKPAIILPLILIVALMIKEILSERQLISERQNISGEQRTSLTNTTNGPEVVHNNTTYSNRILTRDVLTTATLVIVILLCATFHGGQFIYFQF